MGDNALFQAGTRAEHKGTHRGALSRVGTAAPFTPHELHALARLIGQTAAKNRSVNKYFEIKVQRVLRECVNSIDSASTGYAGGHHTG